MCSCRASAGCRAGDRRRIYAGAAASRTTSCACQLPRAAGRCCARKRVSPQKSSRRGLRPKRLLHFSPHVPSPVPITASSRGAVGCACLCASGRFSASSATNRHEHAPIDRPRSQVRPLLRRRAVATGLQFAILIAGVHLYGLYAVAASSDGHAAGALASFLTALLMRLQVHTFDFHYVAAQVCSAATEFVDILAARKSGMLGDAPCLTASDRQ